MSKREWIWWGICIAILGLVVTYNVYAREENSKVPSPQVVIRTVMTTALAEISIDKGHYQSNYEALYTLIDSIVVPHLDSTKLAKSVLGKYWKELKEYEQVEFIDLFQQTIIKTYALYILDYESTYDIKFRETRFNSDGTRAVVEMLVLTERDAVSTSFLLHNNDQYWKIYNFSIDGINLAIIYKTSYASIIQRDGVQGLLQQLREKN